MITAGTPFDFDAHVLGLSNGVSGHSLVSHTKIEMDLCLGNSLNEPVTFLKQFILGAGITLTHSELIEKSVIGLKICGKEIIPQGSPCRNIVSTPTERNFISFMLRPEKENKIELSFKTDSEIPAGAKLIVYLFHYS